METRAMAHQDGHQRVNTLDGSLFLAQGVVHDVNMIRSTVTNVAVQTRIYVGLKDSRCLDDRLIGWM